MHHEILDMIRNNQTKHVSVTEKGGIRVDPKMIYEDSKFQEALSKAKRLVEDE